MRAATRRDASVTSERRVSMIGVPIHAAREERARARRARYAARQEHERAAAAADRPQRRVAELAAQLDRMAELPEARRGAAVNWRSSNIPTARYLFTGPVECVPPGRRPSRWRSAGSICRRCLGAGRAGWLGRRRAAGRPGR
jgi:hypothetical protein